MKAVAFLLGILALHSVTAFELPRGFRVMSELQEAREEAHAEEEPVIFLVTNSALQPT